MMKLTVGDLHLVVTRLPKDIRDVCKNKGVVVGGGFIRETISGGIVEDIDLFGSDKEELGSIAEKLFIARAGKKFVTDNAITLLTLGRLPVQFITRWTFSDLKSCVESFDYTVCQAGLFFNRDVEKWESCINDSFYSDLAAKRLVYTFPQRDEEAGGSIMRAVKFLRRGYNIQPQSLAGAMSRVVAELREETFGDEKQIVKIFEGLLLEVDPLSIVDGVDIVENEHI